MEQAGQSKQVAAVATLLRIRHQVQAADKSEFTDDEWEEEMWAAMLATGRSVILAPPEMVDRGEMRLGCPTCGQRWLALQRPEGGCRPGWWVCPHRCNVDLTVIEDYLAQRQGEGGGQP